MRRGESLVPPSNKKSFSFSPSYKEGAGGGGKGARGLGLQLIDEEAAA